MLYRNNHQNRVRGDWRTTGRDLSFPPLEGGNSYFSGGRTKNMSSTLGVNGEPRTDAQLSKPAEGRRFLNIVY